MPVSNRTDPMEDHDSVRQTSVSFADVLLNIANTNKVLVSEPSSSTGVYIDYQIIKCNSP